MAHNEDNAGGRRASSSAVVVDEYECDGKSTWATAIEMYRAAKPRNAVLREARDSIINEQ